MPSLVFLAGPNTGRSFELTDDGCLIGRHSECQVFVPDMRVSRQHARVRRENGSWHLDDLGSNNGTYVNGRRVQSVTLAPNDEIAIAGNRIRVEMPGQLRPLAPADGKVTIVEMDSPSVYMSRNDAEALAGLSGSLIGAPAEARELVLLQRKLEAVGGLLEIAANTADPDAMLGEVVQQLLEVFPQAASVGVLVEDESTGQLRVQSHISRSPSPHGDDLEVPGTIIDHVTRDRRGVLLREGATTPSLNGEPSGQRMGAPIRARDQSYGVIYVECHAGSFHREDIDLLTSIAAQTGLALHAARMHRQLLERQRLERDLRVARQIQRSLLPAGPPDVVGMEFAVHYEPAYQIGGDFYDFIWHDRTHLGIAVGDVAGKAISAALYMARLTSELRGRAAISRTPARLLARVNAEMLELGDDGMFATLFYAVYDLETRNLVFTNAGHVIPLLRRDGRVFPLHADRAHVPPLGIVPDLEIGEGRLQMQTGDLLIFTSDGVHEARDAAGNDYGPDRLARRLRTARGGAAHAVEAILADVDGHVSSAPQSDDITVVAVGIGGRRNRRRTTTIPGLTDENRER
jgi:phosphoserine phosphatase RsbU/P